MPWLKLDDQIAVNPKMENISWPAVGLWALALAECGRRLTDGVVEHHVIERLTVGREDANPLVQELLQAGLWVEHDAGFLIPDFLEFNPSRAEVIERREKDKQRKRRERSDDLSDRTSERTSERPSQGQSEPPVPAPDPVPVKHPPPVLGDTQKGEEIASVVDGIVEARPDIDPTAITTEAAQLVSIGLEWPHILATVLGNWPDQCRNPTGLVKSRMAKLSAAEQLT